MAKMYLESNNAGLDILITDENGHWWYSGISTNGYYGDAEIYCDGETEEERIGKALENLRREISSGMTYSAEDYIEEIGCNENPVESYDGKMTIDEINNIINYNSDGTPIDHDIISWYEV